VVHIKTIPFYSYNLRLDNGNHSATTDHSSATGNLTQQLNIGLTGLCRRDVVEHLSTCNGSSLPGTSFDFG
jgi:hypothetical protein